MSPAALHELNITTVTKLFTWKANLPAVLHVNTDDYETEYLPHVLLLQYVPAEPYPPRNRPY